MKRQVKLKLRRNDTVLKNAEHVLKSYQQPPNIFREPMNITVTVVGSRGNMFSNIYVQRSTIDKIIQSVLGPNLCWIIRTQGSYGPKDHSYPRIIRTQGSYRPKDHTDPRIIRTQGSFKGLRFSPCFYRLYWLQGWDENI